jgi:DNA-binding XRE family transcriptional regulator
MTDAPLDFEKVELVRERAALTITEMAVLIGVSRVTYHKWKDGAGITKKNKSKIKAVMVRLLALVRSGTWPPEGIHRLPYKLRMKALLELWSASE